MQKYHHWSPKLKYIFSNTQHVELGQNLAQIAQIEQKLYENCLKMYEIARKCEGVHESVWKYDHWITQLDYIILETQHVEIAKILPK